MIKIMYLMEELHYNYLWCIHNFGEHSSFLVLLVGGLNCAYVLIDGLVIALVSMLLGVVSLPLSLFCQWQESYSQDLPCQVVKNVFLLMDWIFVIKAQLPYKFCLPFYFWIVFISVNLALARKYSFFNFWKT